MSEQRPLVTITECLTRKKIVQLSFEVRRVHSDVLPQPPFWNPSRLEMFNPAPSPKTSESLTAASKYQVRLAQSGKHKGERGKGNDTHTASSGLQYLLGKFELGGLKGPNDAAPAYRPCNNLIHARCFAKFPGSKNKRVSKHRGLFLSTAETCTQPRRLRRRNTFSRRVLQPETTGIAILVKRGPREG